MMQHLVKLYKSDDNKLDSDNCVKLWPQIQNDNNVEYKKKQLVVPGLVVPDTNGLVDRTCCNERLPYTEVKSCDDAGVEDVGDQFKLNCLTLKQHPT